MRFIDLHADTIWRMIKDGKEELRRNCFCVDLEKMKQAGSMAQFFACFVQLETEERTEAGYQKALEMIALGKKEFQKNSDEIGFAKNKEDMEKNCRQGKMSAFLTVEEGGIIGGYLERLERLSDEGISLITLLWNHENCIGYPNSRDRHIMQLGLKSFGIEVVQRMNALDMLIDVSHLSDGGFWDVMEYSRKPVVASHSNARTLCEHPRNLTDKMIKRLAEKGGVIGVNFYPYFLNKKGVATAEDIANHMAYIYQVGGEDVVAIGTDFDGFTDGALEVAHMGEMDQVYQAVIRRGFTECQMDKFLARNVMRVLGG